MFLGCTDLTESANKSSTIVALISPACVNDNWNPSTLYSILKQLYTLNPSFCCVTLKAFPTGETQMKNSQGETLNSILRNINVIPWERSNEERFWLSLRLKLPPKRQVTLDQNSTRLTANSIEESLEVCV